MPFDMSPEDVETVTKPEVQTDDEVCRTLRRAAENCRAKGWIQNNWEDCHGRRCVMSHIASAQTEGVYEKCFREVSKFIGIEPGTGEPLINWNNAPERTADEVIAALEGAARARALLAKP